MNGLLHPECLSVDPFSVITDTSLLLKWYFANRLTSPLWHYILWSVDKLDWAAVDNWVMVLNVYLLSWNVVDKGQLLVDTSCQTILAGL